MAEAAVYFNPIFMDANRTRKRYRVMKGSAGSGKSVNVAQDFILRLSDKRNVGANLLVVRKIDESNRDSTFAELNGAIQKIFGTNWRKFWKVNQTTLRMTCKVTGNEIIFRGMKDSRQREKVKSITFMKGKLVWIWIEEATELDENDIEILDDRLRGELININLFYQITMTFNPVSGLHWIKRKFFDYQDMDTFTHHSTYLTNLFIDKAYLRRMERRKEVDPEGYKVYGLGEWGETGGLILTNWSVDVFDFEFNGYDCMIHGQDFGYNHANAILTGGFKDVTTTAGDLYIGHEIYEFEKDTGELIDIAATRNLDKRLPMYCDSAEPDRIKTWRKSGYKARPVHKDPGSVKAQIDILKRLKIHVHPRCKNTIKELQQWKWKKDKSSGLYMDEPVEFMDDAIAALRYMIEEIRRGPAKPWTRHVEGL